MPPSELKDGKRCCFDTEIPEEITRQGRSRIAPPDVEGNTHAVEYITDRWRVDEEWWRGRIWREYFTLIISTGLLMEVFHDLTADKWYVQRVYD